METKFGPPKKPAVASKFLPFITDKSTPLTVFKALVQRTKGIHNQDLCILFSAILSLGVSNLKEKIKNSSNDDSTDHIIKHLIKQYPQYRPSKGTLKFWEYILRNHGIENLKTNADYDQTELTILFTCVAEHRQKFLKEMGFDVDTQLLKPFSSDSHKIKMKDLNVDFTDKENRIGFEGLEELNAYIAYQLATTDSTVSFYPVVIREKGRAGNFVSPYPNEPKLDTDIGPTRDNPLGQDSYNEVQEGVNPFSDSSYPSWKDDDDAWKDKNNPPWESKNK